MHQALTKIDRAAMKVGCFWPEVTKSLEAVDDYPAKVLEEMRSTDAKVRLKASKHLETELRKGVSDQRRKQFGNRAVTSALIDAFADENPKIVHNAVVALTVITCHYFQDGPACERLLPLARSTHPLTSRWAINALIYLRGEASLDDVLPLYQDESREAREMVFNHFRSWLLALKTAAKQQAAGVRHVPQGSTIDGLHSAFVEARS